MVLIGVAPFRDDACLKCKHGMNCQPMEKCLTGRVSDKREICKECGYVFALGEIQNMMGEHSPTKSDGFGETWFLCNDCAKPFFQKAFSKMKKEKDPDEH